MLIFKLSKKHYEKIYEDKVMKKKISPVKTYIKAMAVFIIAVIIGILLFFAGVQHSVEENSQRTMMNNVTRQSEHLRTILSIHYEYLNELANQMGQKEELVCQENIDQLTSIYESTDLDRVALIQPDGTAYYDNGQVKNVSHRRYFQEAISGRQTLSDPLESSVDSETRVVLGVPIYNSQHQVIGVLGASYNVTVLSHMLFDDLFDGEGDTLVVSHEGEILICEDGSADNRNISYGDNLFTYYAEKNIEKDNILAKVKADFSESQTGFIQLGLDNTKAEDYYMTYMPMGMNDWMLCYIVPVSAAQQTYSFIQKYELIFLITFCIFVAILIIYIAYKNNREKAKILEVAQRDALTGLYNKNYAQRFIEHILKTQPGKYGFIILDIDFFKEVNDNYGHLVGDKVLRAFGNFLKSQFREDDIVGRIGGDEFVILMRNLTDQNAVESKIQKLLNRISELRIEEMNGQGITISVGIALAPQHGKSFMELYQNADQALYRMKRAGKNGYSVYQPEK